MAVTDRYAWWMAQPNSALATHLHGLPAISVNGTTSARNVAATNHRTRQFRIAQTSAATAAAVANFRMAAAIITLGDGTTGGFRVKSKFMIADAATVAGARMFHGVSASTAVATNVEPSTLVNCIGVGHGAADTNLKLFYGGTAAQTPIDLGANFPITANSAHIYELELYCPKGSTTVQWWVRRFTNSDVADFTASGTLGPSTAAVLPAATVLLTPLQSYRTNNATALAVAVDYLSLFLDRLPG